MLTRKQLSEHFDHLCLLNQNKQAAEILRENLKELEQNPGLFPDPQFLEALSQDLAEQEKGIEDLAAEIKSREPDVRHTLSQASDPLVRTAAQLHFLRGLSWKEIGAFLGHSENAVKSRVYRSLPAEKSKCSKREKKVL